MSNDCKCCGPAMVALVEKLSVSIHYAAELECNSLRGQLTEVSGQMYNLRRSSEILEKEHDKLRVELASAHQEIRRLKSEPERPE